MHHGPPLDADVLRDRWQLALWRVDRSLAGDAPHAALARARRLRAEAAEVFAEHPELDRGELRELGEAILAAVVRCRRRSGTFRILGRRVGLAERSGR